MDARSNRTLFSMLFGVKKYVLCNWVLILTELVVSRTLYTNRIIRKRKNDFGANTPVEPKDTSRIYASVQFCQIVQKTEFLVK